MKQLAILVLLKDGAELKKFITYPLPALLTPLPLIPSTTKITGCTNEAATGTNKAPRNLPSCLFHVLLFQELHKLRHANLLMI